MLFREYIVSTFRRYKIPARSAHLKLEAQEHLVVSQEKITNGK